MSRNYYFTLWVALSLPALPATGAVLRVCQSGCTYSTVQAAVNAAVAGDVVEVEAGQTFVEGVFIPPKSGVTVRSSRWQELPPLTERIDPEAHAELLATIRMPNAFAPALALGREESVIFQNGVDVEADTMRFEFPNGLANNVAVACFGDSLPVPLVKGTKYYLRNYNTTTRAAQFSVEADGPAIDLLDNGSAGESNYYRRPRCTVWDAPSDWTFRGLRLESAPNTTAQVFWLARIGSNQQPNLDMGPHNIRLHQMVLTGQPTGLLGPASCLAVVAGRGHEVISSWIGHCQGINSLETKGIWLQNTEDVEIRNNYVSAATINILTAGGNSASGENVKNIRIRGNFIEKPGYMMYRAGTGEPQGECYYGGGSGAFYRRTDVTPNTCENGACYTCQEDNTWALDTETFYRPNHLNTKNLIEFKDCDTCVVEGNFLRGAYVGPDAGQGPCLLFVTGSGDGFGSGYHRNHNLTVRNNWCDQVYKPILVSSGTAGSNPPPFQQLPLRNVTVENNLFTNIGRHPALSQWPSPSDSPVRNVQISTGFAGLRFANNTFRPAPGSTARNAIFLLPGGWPDDPFVRDADIRNNIFQFDGSTQRCAFCLTSPPADTFSCNANGVLRFLPDTTEKQIQHNLFSGGVKVNGVDFLTDAGCTSRMFQNNQFLANIADLQYVSAVNHRLAPTSPYSAQNPDAVLVGQDGRDLGTDVDELEMYALPAIEGKAPMPEQLQLQIETGATQAVIRFVRPAEGACSVRVYGTPARVEGVLISDSLGEGRTADDREGNIIEGAQVQFLVGHYHSLPAETSHFYFVHCGSLWAVGQFRTRKMGDPDPEEDAVIESGASGDQAIVEYSMDPSFSNMQTAGPINASGGQLVIRLPASAMARYVRYRILDGQGNVKKQSGVRIQPSR